MSANPNLLAAHLDELRDGLRAADPQRLAARTGASYQPVESGKGIFHLRLWEQEICLSFPNFVASDYRTQKELGVSTQALLLYYFSSSDGTPEARTWISFSELPDGRFYNQAFQGYTGKELARSFKDDSAAFDDIARKLGGIPQPVGDLSFAFQLLPRLSLVAVFWQGDEDFPSAFQILFDAAASHHLPTDACAIAASMLVRKLISEYGSGAEGA